MSESLLEWTPFRLKPTVAQQSLLAASEMLQREFLSAQPGFVRRLLLSAGDGSYVDLIWWNSMEAAEAAMNKAASDPSWHEYSVLMANGESGPRLHLFQPIADYSSAGGS
jgi:hypothetical protein